jgi:hypothetical protein
MNILHKISLWLDTPQVPIAIELAMTQIITLWVLSLLHRNIALLHKRVTRLETELQLTKDKR